MKNTIPPSAKELYLSPETGIFEWNSLYCCLQQTSPGGFNDEEDYGGDLT